MPSVRIQKHYCLVSQDLSKPNSPQPKAVDGIPEPTLAEGFGEQGNPWMSRGQAQCRLVDSTRGEQDEHLWAQGTQAWVASAWSVAGRVFSNSSQSMSSRTL